MSAYHLPPGPSILTAFLRSFDMMRDPIETILKNIDEYGDTYGIKTGIGNQLIMTRDPAFINYVLKKNHKNYEKSPIVSEKLGRFLGKGLLTSNGEEWLRQRRLIQPGFHKQRIHKLYGLMQETINDYLDKQQKIWVDQSGEMIDVFPVVNKLAFEIVINSLFNISMPAEKKQELLTIITEIQAYVIKEIRQPYKYQWFKLSGTISHFLKRSGRAREILRSLVRDRKKSGEKVNDLLDMLLEIRYEDTGLAMEEEKLVDEIIILITAGHETSANAMAWALYLLAMHPEKLNTLRDKTKQLDVNSAANHTELFAVVKEAMRLYPPAWITDRIALEDDEFNGYTFPKGTIVVTFFYGIHHHPDYWEQPEAFMPERFINDPLEKLVKEAYYPFGAGPRFCIGSGFAMSEMALFIHSFIHRYNFTTSTEIPKRYALVTLRPDRVMLKLQLR